MFNNIQNRLQKAVSQSKESAEANFASQSCKDPASGNENGAPKVDDATSGTVARTTQLIEQVAKPREVAISVEEQLAQAKKIEQKFQELLKAYKNAMARHNALETVVRKHTPLKAVSTVADLDAFSKFLDATKRLSASATEISPGKWDALSTALVKSMETDGMSAETQASVLAIVKQNTSKFFDAYLPPVDQNLGLQQLKQQLETQTTVLNDRERQLQERIDREQQLESELKATKQLATELEATRGTVQLLEEQTEKLRASLLEREEKINDLQVSLTLAQSLNPQPQNADVKSEATPSELHKELEEEKEKSLNLAKQLQSNEATRKRELEQLLDKLIETEEVADVQTEVKPVVPPKASAAYKGTSVKSLSEQIISRLDGVKRLVYSRQASSVQPAFVDGEGASELAPTDMQTRVSEQPQSLKKQLSISRKEASQLKLDLEGLQNQLRDTVNEMEEQITQKEVTLGEVVKRVSQLQEALGKKNELIAALQASVTQLEQELARRKVYETEHKGSLERLQEEKTAMIQRLSDMAAKRETVTKEFELKFEKQEKEVTSLNDNIKGYQNQIRLLEVQARQLEKRVEELGTQADSNMSSSSSSSLAIAPSPTNTGGKSKKALSRKVSNLEKQVESLGALLREKEQRINELSIASNDCPRGDDAATTQLRNDLDKLVLENKRLSSSAADDAVQLAKLEASRAALEVETTQLRGELAAKCEELSVLESRQKQQQQSDETLEQKLSETVDALRSAEVKLKEEEEKKSKSIQLLRNSKTRILKLESEKRDLESSLRSRETKISELYSTVASAEAEKTSLETKLRDASAALKKLEEEVSDFNAKVSQLEQQREKLQLQVKQLETTTEAKKVEFEEKLREVEQRNGQVEPFIARIKELERHGELLSAEVDSSKAMQLVHSEENDHLKCKIMELERLLYAAEQVSVELKERINVLEQEVRSIIAENSTLEQKIVDLEGEKSRISDEWQQLQVGLEQHRSKQAAQEQEVEELRLKLQVLQTEKAQLAQSLESTKASAACETPNLSVRPMVQDAETNTAYDTSSVSSAGGAKERPPLPPLNIPLTLPRALSSNYSQQSVTNLGNAEPVAGRQRGYTASNSSSNASLATSVGSSRSSSRNMSELSLQPTGDGSLVDLQYLKSVVIKFFERKDMRKQLVPVISTLLHLNNEEIKRILKSQ